VAAFGERIGGEKYDFPSIDGKSGHIVPERKEASVAPGKVVLEPTVKRSLRERHLADPHL
jgi:hypothetical protein